jgi:hypothetical protein
MEECSKMFVVLCPFFDDDDSDDKENNEYPGYILPMNYERYCVHIAYVNVSKR